MTRLEAQRKSWRDDKAVQDNIVESWLCVDCGVNTHPGSLSGPEIRVALALKSECDLTFTKRCEVYSVKDDLWKQAGMRPWSGCLCVGCLEKRIGRQVRPRDFARHDKKVWADMPCTERLLNRRGYATVTVNTRSGPKEMIVALKDAARLNDLTANGATMDEEGAACSASRMAVSR
jgi:hypothetical protein